MSNSVQNKNMLSISFGTGRQREEIGVHTLYDQHGHRKYLIASERDAFLAVARTAEPETETFCLMLAYTGARISEVLNLTADRFDIASGLVVFETLKRRKRGLFRPVPVPQKVLRQITTVHGFSGSTHGMNGAADERLWPWCRTTAWHRVKEVMADAGIEGPQASPKGLRHAFGVLGLQSGVPLNLISRWLGHARLETTAIYAEAVGEEEKAIAQRFWKTF